MLRRITIAFYLFILINCKLYAQSNHKNLGISFNLLGPIFGEYNLGVSTLLNPFVQIGASGILYDTQFISPEVQGWQNDLRINYFFSSFYRSGFYLGISGGFESVKVKKDASSKWETYDDFTWAFTPGYAWLISQSFTTLLGLSYGYNLGDIQFGPEIGFVLLL